MQALGYAWVAIFAAFYVPYRIILNVLKRPWVVLLLLLAVIGVSAVYGTGITPLDDSVQEGLSVASGLAESMVELADSAGQEQDGADAGRAATTTPDQGSGGGGVDRSKLEAAVHRQVNEERSAEGLSTLDFDGDLREIARYHSEDMASAGYFDHTSPLGETRDDRYERFNYDCRVPAGGDTYYTGGENIFRIDGAGTNEEEIADQVVSSWMASPGHRENLLRPEFRREGIGVATGDSGVYVTQNFC